MQVFNAFFKVLKSQLVSIMIYAVMFLWLTIMLTANIKVENEEFKVNKIKTMVINHDKDSSLVKGFLKYMEDYIIFIEPEEDEEGMKDALFYRKALYILTIPEGFSEAFLKQGTVDLKKQIVPDTIGAISVDNAINNYFNIAKVYLKHIPDINYDDLNTYVENNLKEQTPVNIEGQLKDEVTYSNGFNRNFFNYLAYIMISMFITGVSMVMLSFQRVDIRRRHSASPLANRHMNFQLILANLIFVFVYVILFVAAGYLLNRDRMLNSNTILTWINVVVFAVTTLSISYLVGITVKSRKAIAAISTALSLSMAFLSGIFVPQEYLGASVLKVASFMPTYWYVKANNSIELLNSFGWKDISGIIGYMGIQLGFAAAIFSIALVVSKRKTQQAF